VLSVTGAKTYPPHVTFGRTDVSTVLSNALRTDLSKVLCKALSSAMHNARSGDLKSQSTCASARSISLMNKIREPSLY
jgi:hypothetical protein